MGGILQKDRHKRTQKFAALALLWAALWLACCGGAQADEQQALIWRVCITDTVAPPYLYNDPTHPGLTERILSDAGRQVGMSMLFLRFPPRRCRAMFEAGSVDALLAVPVPGNEKLLQLPSKGGAVDSSRRVTRINIVWVRRSDSTIGWDGTHFTDLPEGKAPLVGTRVNFFAAKDRLAAAGIAVDDNALNTHQALAKLVAHRVDVVLALQEEVEYAIHDEQMSELVILPRAFQTMDYYVGVHHGLPADIQAKVEAWWTAIGQLRDRPAYRYSGAGN